MYHFDYVLADGGTAYESHNGRQPVKHPTTDALTMPLEDFIHAFVLIENYRHPFTIAMTQKRKKTVDKLLEAYNYTSMPASKIHENFGGSDTFSYGYWCADLPQPFPLK